MQIKQLFLTVSVNILYWQHVPEKEKFVTTFKFGKKHFLVKVIINLTLYTLGHLEGFSFFNKLIITCTNSFTSDEYNSIHSLFNIYIKKLVDI